MTTFIDTLLEQPLSGIPAVYWQSFLKIFSEGVDANKVERKLKSMRDDAEKAGLTADGLEAFDRVQDALRDLVARL